MSWSPAELEALKVGAKQYPQRFYSHDGDGLDLDSSTITQRWVGSPAILWRRHPLARAVPEGAVEFLPWAALKRVIDYEGPILDLDNLPRGHWIDKRLLALADERCASKVVVWDTREKGKGIPHGVLLKGYDPDGRVNLLAMGLFEPPTQEVLPL